MKKLFSILMTFVFVLSLGTVAFAIEEDTNSTPVPVIARIPKSFTLENAGKLNPAETFTFSFTQQAATVNTNLATVAIPNTTVAYIAGETSLKYGDISLANFTAAPVGRYTYAVAEVVPDPQTAGMTYTTRTGTLVVDKEYDGTVKSYLIIGTMGTDMTKKFDNFDNKFAAGDLNITKQVTGNLGDKNKLFDVTVTLTAPAGKVVKNGVMELWKNGAPTTPSPTPVNFTGNTAIVTFQVKDGDTFTIKNLPYGVTYVVEETDPLQGYGVTYEGKTGTIDNILETAKIINDRHTEIPTGISLDSLPYILILGLAASGMAVLFFRKRQAF